MKSKFIAGALAGALFFGLSASPSHALTFHYSFAGGNIQGNITGLEDNSNAQPADSVTVTASIIGGVGEYAPSAFNIFSVSGGVLVGAFFQNTVGDFSLSLNLANASLFDNEEESGLGTAVSYSLVAETTPLPAAVWLFAGGLGLLGMFYRKKEKPKSAWA